MSPPFETEPTSLSPDTGGRAPANLLTRLRKLCHDPTAPVLALCLTVIAVIRYCMTAQHADMGCDIAGYLSTMDTLFGLDVTGFGLLRPPSARCR